MAQDPVSPRVRGWYGLFYLLPVGRLEESLEQQKQGLKEDPLNLMSRIGFAMSLFGSGRLAQAQSEAERILEFEENHPWALGIVALTYACQKRWKEALSLVEKVSPPIPSVICIQAGLLKCMGETDRAEELIQKCAPGEAYDSPSGLAGFYYLCGEIDKAADYIKKLIEQSYPRAAHLALMYARSSPQFSVLARLMNLPEAVR